MNKFVSIWTGLAIAAVSIGLATPVHAQIEEIVVTARKKEENLQEIPLSITAVSGETIERKGFQDIADLIKFTAGIQYDTIFSPDDTRVVIRGLSPTRGRPNVAFLQDGIDISSEAVASAGGSVLINPRLYDLERIEIVKGPQSALYGRTAFAGAINYVTKRPGDELERKVTLDFGDHGQREITGSISGPVIEDKLRLGINAAIWEHDGYYSNSVTGADIGDEEGIGVSLAALFTPNDDVTVFARMEYTDDEFGIYPWAQSPGNTMLTMPVEALGTVISPAAAVISGYAGGVADAEQQTVRISPDPKTGLDYPGTTREIFRASIILDWEVEWGTVSWLAAYADTSTTLFNENTRQGDVNALGFFTVIDYENDMSMWSHELRLSSNQEQSVRWMVGANVWDEDAHQDQGGFACLSLPFLPCGPFIAALDPFPARTFDRDESSTSVYGAVEFDINDQLTLSLEGRFFWEDQDVAGPDAARVIDPIGLFGPFPVTQFGPLGTNYGSSSDNYFTPRATLEYQRDEDTMLYLSIAQGGKPSGISTTGAGAGPFNPDTFGFDEETVWVYELGAKTTLLDGRLVANGAIYYQDFSGKQATSQVILENGLLGTKTVNASDAEVTGLEIDLNWAITDNLTGTLGYSYIDATYGSFVTSTGGPSQIAQVGNCTPVVLAGSTLCNIDRSGNRMEDTSKHHLVTGLSMRGDLADGNSWLVEADLAYNSDRFDTADNILKLDSYWMANLRGGVVGDNWEVIGYVDNLFDDDTIKTAFLSTDFSTIALFFFPPPFTFVLANGVQVRMPDPRQVGVRATFRF